MSAARVIKEHEERKNELLDAAEGLFNEKGFDATPVTDIIDKVGVAKGTFYHYFHSKDLLLDALVARFTRRILKRVEDATSEQGMDALNKLNAFFRVAARWKAVNRRFIVMLLKALYRDENVRLRYKITRVMVKQCVAPLARIVEQGTREGVFNVKNAEDTAELILELAIAMREATARLFLDVIEQPDLWPVIERKMGNYQAAIEKILGAPEGSIRLTDEETMALFRAGHGNSDKTGREEA